MVSTTTSTSSTSSDRPNLAILTSCATTVSSFITTTETETVTTPSPLLVPYTYTKTATSTLTLPAETETETETSTLTVPTTITLTFTQPPETTVTDTPPLNNIVASTVTSTIRVTECGTSTTEPTSTTTTTTSSPTPIPSEECECEDWEEECNGDCYNLLTDANNCGKCGNVCPGGDGTCVNGVCSATCSYNPRTGVDTCAVFTELGAPAECTCATSISGNTFCITDLETADDCEILPTCTTDKDCGTG
ncbi:hypothetical protein V8F06_007647 [Rhypophila decipiens]